jgi:hypothetical protein
MSRSHYLATLRARNAIVARLVAAGMAPDGVAQLAPISVPEWNSMWRSSQRSELAWLRVQIELWTPMVERYESRQILAAELAAYRSSPLGQFRDELAALRSAC